jgi:hypothetical protein
LLPNDPVIISVFSQFLFFGVSVALQEAAFKEGGNKDETSRVHRRLSGQLYEALAASDEADRRRGDDRRLARAAAPMMPGAHATAWSFAVQITIAAVQSRWLRQTNSWKRAAERVSQLTWCGEGLIRAAASTSPRLGHYHMKKDAYFR